MKLASAAAKGEKKKKDLRGVADAVGVEVDGVETQVAAEHLWNAF